MSATITAYQDVVRALRAMPALAIAAGLIVIGISTVNVLLVEPIIPARSLLGREIMGLVSNFLLTPFLVAVHRFIILGEVTPRYALDVRDTRILHFFGFAAVLYVAMSLLLVMSKVLEALASSASALSLILSVLVIVFSIGLIIVSVRATILFPAVAVDAEGATWENALHDAKGHGWYIVILVVVSSIPFVLAIAVMLLMKAAMPSLPMSIAALVVGDIVAVAYTALLVAIASRLYQALGDRLNRPVASPVS
jgi:hypothetical protein